MPCTVPRSRYNAGVRAMRARRLAGGSGSGSTPIHEPSQSSASSGAEAGLVSRCAEAMRSSSWVIGASNRFTNRSNMSAPVLDPTASASGPNRLSRYSSGR